MTTIIMDTKRTLKKRVWCRSIALSSMLIAAICVFSTKTIAQSNANAQDGCVESNKSVLLLDAQREYNQILEKYIVEKGDRKICNLNSITEGDLNRLKELFLTMSLEQQSELTHIFMRREVPAERIPTNEEYELWKSPTDYGIWLDGKRIENSELDRYQASDFSHYYVSRLQRNAKDFGKYVYHLELSTTKNYKDRKEKADADKALYLMPNFKRGT